MRPPCHCPYELQAAIVANSLNGVQIAVGYAQLPIWRGEHQTISHSKLALNFTISADALEPGRIVGNLFSIGFLHREQVVFGWVEVTLA